MPRTLKEIGAVGILERNALRDLNAACERVLALLWDMQPHTSEEIDIAAGSNGNRARRGLARKHELVNAGFDIRTLPEKRNGLFQYQLMSRELPNARSKQMDLIPQTRRYA